LEDLETGQNVFVFLPVSLSFVDDAVPALPTGVGQLLADGSLEETFTTFATVNAVMFTCKKMVYCIFFPSAFFSEKFKDYFI
jgi:hypothetical protein